jgi:hypothetical protein
LFYEALREKGSITEIDLAVTPGSKEEGIRGYDPWRRRINLRVRALPMKGRANKAVTAFLADFFKISTGDVKIIKGKKDNMKTVLLNIDIERAVERLRDEFERV